MAGSMAYMFSGATIPDGFNLQNWDTGSVMSFNSTFESSLGAASIGDIEAWDISKAWEHDKSFLNSAITPPPCWYPWGMFGCP